MILSKLKLLPGQTNITRNIIYIIILILLSVYICWILLYNLFCYFQIAQVQQNFLKFCTRDSSIKFWYLGTAESFVLIFSTVDTSIKFWSLDRVIMKLIQAQKIFISLFVTEAKFFQQKIGRRCLEMGRKPKGFVPILKSSR